MSGTVAVAATVGVTIDGETTISRALSKSITVDGRYFDSGVVQVAVTAVKTIVDLTDASVADLLKDSAGSNGGFKFALIECVSAEVAADISFVELVADVGTNNETLRFELPSGAWLMLCGDGALVGGTDGIQVYGSIGSPDNIEAIRVINRSAGTVATFRALLVR